MLEKSVADYLKTRSENALISHIGMEFTSYENGVLTGEMPVDNRTRQVNNYLNGGASLAFAESLAGSASALILADNPNKYAVGVQVSGNHVSSALVGDTVIGTCTQIHIGRSTHVWNVDIRSKNTGKLISSIRVQNFVKTRK